MEVLRQEALGRTLLLPPGLPDEALVEVHDTWLVRSERATQAQP